MDKNLLPHLRKFSEIWDVHHSADWPTDLGSNEGELMMIDTVVSGCVTYFLESSDGLDPQRVEILQSCLADLDNLFPDLHESAMTYFDRIRVLSSFMLNGTPIP